MSDADLSLVERSVQRCGTSSMSNYLIPYSPITLLLYLSIFSCISRSTSLGHLKFEELKDFARPWKPIGEGLSS